MWALLNPDVASLHNPSLITTFLEQSNKKEGL